MTFTTGEIDTQQWIENLRLPNGRPPRLDLYGHNPFTSRDPNLANPPSPAGGVDFSDLRRLAGWIDRYLGRGRPQIKLFLSEWTIPTAVDDEFNFFVAGKSEYLPIPTSEINLNPNIRQNPGY